MRGAVRGREWEVAPLCKAIAQVSEPVGAVDRTEYLPPK